MFDEYRKRNCPTVAVLSAVMIVVLAAGTAVAEDPTMAAPLSTPAAPALSQGTYPGGLSFLTTLSSENRRGPGSDASAPGKPVHASRFRRITLQQVKQESSADRALSPLMRLGQLSIEAAKQHRLGAQADYFPKIGATFANLHYSEFLGQILSIRRPLQGGFTQVPVPLFSQNQTVAAATFVQPITPLFQVYQLVQIARADERIAMAKAGVSMTSNAREAEVELAYFKLLLAQRRLTSAESKLRIAEKSPLNAAASIELVRTPAAEPSAQLLETKKAVVGAAAEVKELATSLNRMMGWPEDTELELVTPEPLIENVSLQEIARKTPPPTPDLVEAQQTAVKAHAASVLSKLAYMPTLVAVGGYLFQNAIPLVPSNFGYGGVMVSYNLFDFGKREHAVKEASAQLEMANLAVEMTKAKLAASVQKSYLELERSRQLSQMAQKMGSSVALLMNVSSTSENLQARAARAALEVQLIEADLAHRQAYAHLKALTGLQ